MKKSVFIFLAFIFGFFSSFQVENFCRADIPTVEPRLSKWEIGAALGYFYLPDYPGAAESQERFLVLPYGIYRGDIIRSDEDGLRGRFLNHEKIELDLSFGAGFPTSSADNKARADMSNLEWMGEIGPRLLVRLYKKFRGARRPLIELDLALPIRYVFTTDFRDYDSRGYVFNPDLRFRHRALFDTKTTFSFGGGPLWATESLHDYFYEVSERDATADRPIYDAGGGYMGLRTSISAERNFSKDVTVFIGIARDFYADAKNRGSPLLNDIETERYFLGLAWALYASGFADEKFMANSMRN